MRFWSILAVSVATLAGLAANSPAQQPAQGKPGEASAQPAPAGLEILNENSYYRWRRVTAELTFATEGGSAAAPKEFAGRKAPLSPNPEDVPPPADWTGAGFDDSHWMRVRPAAPAVTDGQVLTDGAFRLCLRGRFEVTDPAAVKELTLGELEFAGGAIVYLNGKEVARAHLPAGPLADNATAEPYPESAWPRGREKKEQLDVLRAAQTRKLGPVRLPVDLLRKGVNVLAIELRRSPSSPTGWQKWQPIDLNTGSLSLRAVGGGVVANTSRPKGLRVWVEDVNDRITERDWADPNEPIGPLRIVAARNGSFGGIVVASSTEPLAELKVELSDLKAVQGNATIPASAADLLSLQSDGRAYARTNWFDGLVPGVPAKADVFKIEAYRTPTINDAAVVPVYVRLNVPKDAAPGDYRGSVTVRAAGAEPVVAPVEVYVSPWVVPDPKDYRTYVGLYQSPTSVALQYKVEMWSEQHWKLLDKSFSLLGRVGNKMINVCVAEQTQFGNDRGMVYWIRKPDGTFDYDFTIFDRFVGLAKKHLGPLDYVALQVWHAGGWGAREADQENTVTVYDPATGKFDRMQVPKFDSEEARAFWRPFLAQAKAHLDKLGMGDAMCIGILSDGTAPSSVFKMFDEVWPGGGPARWTRGLHTQREDRKPYRADRAGGLVVLHEHCYGSPMLTVADEIKDLSTLRGSPVTAYFRFSGFETVCTLTGYRLLTDKALFLRKQGIGRICFDFWDVVPSRHGDYGSTLYNRYPHSSCAQRAPALYKLSWPGPDGAESTQRFEVLCEGVQESEAMLAIAAALDQKKPLDKATADRCRKLLYDRLWFVTTRPIQAEWNRMLNHSNHFGWQQLARETFDCAAAASAK